MSHSPASGRAGLGFFAALLAGQAAVAQQALFSNLALDAAIAPQQNAIANLEPNRSHIGPVQFHLAVYSSVKFDDNINLVQANPQSDTIVGAGVDLELAWPVTEQSVLRLGSSIGYAKYLEGTLNDSLDISPNSALTWSFSFEDGVVTFFDQFSYSRQVITEAAISGVAALPRFDNTIGTRVSWQPKHWLIETGYSHNNHLSDSDQFQYLDRNSEYIFFRLARKFAENTQAGIESSISLTDYRLSTQNDSTSYSIGPYVDWQLTEFINASVRGGPTFYTFKPNSMGMGGRDLTSYYLGGKLTHKLTDYFWHELNVQRDVSLGLSEGNSYIEQLTFNYSVHWTITEQCNLNLSVFYERGSQPLDNFSPPAMERFNRLGYNFFVSYAITQKLSAGLNYWHWDRASNLNGRNYDENNVTLGLRYTF